MEEAENAGADDGDTVLDGSPKPGPNDFPAKLSHFLVFGLVRRCSKMKGWPLSSPTGHQNKISGSGAFLFSETPGVISEYRRPYLFY